MDTTNNMTSPNSGTDRTLTRTVDDASALAHGTIDKASAAARPAVDRMANSAHQAVDKVATVATQAADSLCATGEKLTDASTRMSTQCRSYVRENPLTSLGMAVAVGFALSRIVNSR